MNAYDFGALAATANVPAVPPPIRKPAAAATIPILTSDVEVGIDTRPSAVTVQLPSVVAWSNQNKSGLDLMIIDYFGDAAAHNITPSLFAGDTFTYGGVTPVIRSNFGHLALRPDPSVPTWLVIGVN